MNELISKIEAIVFQSTLPARGSDSDRVSGC